MQWRARAVKIIGRGRRNGMRRREERSLEKEVALIALEALNTATTVMLRSIITITSRTRSCRASCFGSSIVFLVYCFVYLFAGCSNTARRKESVIASVRISQMAGSGVGVDVDVPLLLRTEL